MLSGIVYSHGDRDWDENGEADADWESSVPLLNMAGVHSELTRLHQQHYRELFSFLPACKELFDCLPDAENKKLIELSTGNHSDLGGSRKKYLNAIMTAEASDKNFCIQCQCTLLKSENAEAQEAGIKLLSWVIRRSQADPKTVIAALREERFPVESEENALSPIEKAFLLSMLPPVWNTKISWRSKKRICQRSGRQREPLSLDKMKQQFEQNGCQCDYKLWLKYILQQKPKIKNLKKLVVVSDEALSSFFIEENVIWWMLELLSNNYGGEAAQLIRNENISSKKTISSLLEQEVSGIVRICSVKPFAGYWCEWILNTLEAKNLEQIQRFFKVMEHDSLARVLLQSKAYMKHAATFLSLVIQWDNKDVTDKFRFTFQNRRQVLSGLHKGLAVEGIKVPGRFTRKVASTYGYLEKVISKSADSGQALPVELVLSQLESCDLPTSALARAAWEKKSQDSLKTLVDHAPSPGKLLMECSFQDRKKFRSFLGVTHNPDQTVEIAESSSLTEYLVTSFEQCKPEAALFHAAGAGLPEHCDRLVKLGISANSELKGLPAVFRALESKRYHTAMALVDHGAKWQPLNSEQTRGWACHQPVTRYCRQIIIATQNPWSFYFHLFRKHPEISDYVIWDKYCWNNIQPVHVRADHGGGPLKIYLNNFICKNNNASDVAAAMIGRLGLLGYQLRHNRDVRVVVLMNNGVKKKVTIQHPHNKLVFS